MAGNLVVRWLGLKPYEPVWRHMLQWTLARSASTTDELWLLEHPQVFTLGQAGQRHHILQAGNIPIVESDRGGQVTYHGPGQLVAYLLMDIRRMKLNIRAFVTAMEQAVVAYLATHGIRADTRADAPGVYVNDAKIAALGLRVKKGCTYHGLSFNVHMSLQPFRQINPCGFPGLAVTQLWDLGIRADVKTVALDLIPYIQQQFGFDTVTTAESESGQS